MTIQRAGLDDAVVQGLLAELPWGVGDLTAPEFAPPAGSMLVACDAGEPVGCVGVRRLDASTGEVKRLFVRPVARGRGVARELLAEAEVVAAELGYRQLWLDTHADEPAALFASVGYRAIPAYNTNHWARHWFAKVLDPRDSTVA